MAMLAIALGLGPLAAVSTYDQAEAFTFIGGQAQASGPSATLTPWTITNYSASPMTNVPIEIPIQFSSAGGPHPFLPTDAIQVVDSDGTTVIGVGEWGRYSDKAGPDLRGIHKLVCILPNLGASQARQLTIKKLANTAPTTGTDISAADIAATGFTCPAVMSHSNGTTYTADVATGLANSGWSNKTTAANTGTWISGNGFATSHVVKVPYKNGATPAPNNIMLWAEVTAYKGQRGAVSGLNPIIAIRVQYWTKSAFAQESSPVNHWYDLTTTCGTNVQAWVGNAAPAKTITLSVYINPNDPGHPDPINTRGSQSVVTVPAGGTTFTANSVGQMISDGTGQAVITEYTSATVVVARVTTQFAGTTILSGTWRMWGVNQQFSSDIPLQEIWYGGSLAITTKPNIDSSLGVAWNSGTLTGGPFTYLRDCKMILPFTTAASAITNSMAQLNACGANPTGTPSGFIGDWTAYMPTTGGRDDIAPVPGFYVGGLIRYDANGKAKIMGDAIKSAMFPMWYIDENTGKALQFNNGIDYFLADENWSGTRLPIADHYITGGAVNEITNAVFQVAHHPGFQTIPIYLTGDFYYVESLQQQVFACWAQNNPGYAGSQLNRVFCSTSEFRGNAWTFRDIMAALLFVPDAGNACLSYTKAHLNTIFGNQFTATNSGVPDLGPLPGINIGLVNNTGSGKVYAASGYRQMTQGGGGDISQWQLGYALFGFFQCKLMGMVTGDCDAFMTWMMEGLTGVGANAAVNTNWFAPIYYGRAETDTGTPVNSWFDVYRWSGFDMVNGAGFRLVTGAGITLSGLSGSGITVTMPAGYFTTGGSAFYAGCPFMDRNAASLQVVPMALGTRADFGENEYTQGVDVVSGSNGIPPNSGSIRVSNTSANNVYVKLTVGGGTATPSDTLVAPGAAVPLTVGTNTVINYISVGGPGNLIIFGSAGAYDRSVDVISSNSILPGNAGTIKVWNTSASNVYVKGSVGPGTATASDTFVAPGTSVKMTVGANTYLNYIAVGGYGAITVFGSSGTGYANGDTITVTFGNVASNFTVTTPAALTVSDVGVAGDVIAVTISTPGLYVALTAGSTGGTDDTLTQTSTSAAGVGFFYRAMARDQVVAPSGISPTVPLRFGVGMVTSVSGNVLTIKTTGSWRGGTVKCYPFAQTSLVSNKIRVGAPAPGDSNGLSPGIADPFLPTPYTSQHEYWTIALNCAFMANQYSYANAATAYANIANDYTGPSELKWKVV